MEKIQKNEKISDRSDHQASKSYLLKNLNSDVSHNSLLSSDKRKKFNDKNNNDIKQFNITPEKNINKIIKKNAEEDLFSIDDSKYERSRNKKIEKKKIKPKNDLNNKTIVDDLQNVYSCINDKSNTLFLIQKILLLLITFLVNTCHWVFLLINIYKLERDYCFTNLNQFESCTSLQICFRNQNKITMLLYNDSLNIHNNSNSFHQNFMEEFQLVNNYYRSFFINYTYQISQSKLFSSLNMVDYDSNRLNLAIILSKKEQWNIFLKFYSLCQSEYYFFWIDSIIVFSGCIGSIVFGVLADVFGRKKLIHFNLLIITISLAIIIIVTFYLENSYKNYLEEYQNNYSSSSDYDNILSLLYAQGKTSSKFEKSTLLYFIPLFFICLTLRPLTKISLALLLENSTNELKVLQVFRQYTFVTTGVSPLFAFLVLIVFNDFTVTIIILDLIFFIFFILSFFFINESIRWHYEYCEWKELTQIIKKLFNINEKNTAINYKNRIEFEAFRLEESKKMLGNFQKKTFIGNNINNIFSGNSIYNIFKKRLISLQRDIRRNSEVIIKKEEIHVNPIILFICLISNRVFNKSKILFLMLLSIIYVQVHFVEKELMKIPFFQLSDLYFDINNNYIINSNFFILCIITLVSNYFYFGMHRISCFKVVLFISLIAVTLLQFIYHFASEPMEDFSLDLNQANFEMYEVNSNLNRKKNIIFLILGIYFILNGINFYINLLILKLSKTLYRCTLFGFNSFVALLAFAFGESLNYQIEHYFFLVGSLNIVGIVTILYFGELKVIPYIINDLKQNIKREKNKTK